MKFIKNLSLNELNQYFELLEEKKFRTKQLLEAIYKNRVNSFDEISNFPKELRQKLSEDFSLTSLEFVDYVQSQDNSKKILYKVKNSNDDFIETIFLPNSKNLYTAPINTLCISTMLGCPINCAFCATAKLGFNRNLTVSEILDQVLLTEQIFNQKINNVVLMGMGEPLLNYNNVLEALKILTTYNIINRKNITLSTVGIPQKIIQLADSDIKTKLALSLHSPFDEVRKQLIPNAYKLNEIFKALDYYYKKTKLAITFEYILFKTINNREEDIQKLVKLSRRFPSKINIIPFNDISFTGTSQNFSGASIDEISLFAEKLNKEKVLAIVRNSQGQDIAAACGQLAYNLQKK